MIFAKKIDFEKVKQIFYKHKKWFPHVRTDYMMRMIDRKQLILEDGVLITFTHAKRRQKIGDVQVEKGDNVLHQIRQALVMPNQFSIISLNIAQEMCLYQ